MSQYKYKPLKDSGDEIRLLNLMPGQPSDDIQIEIFHASFRPGKTKDYEALSYAWGSTENMCNVMVRAQRGKVVTALSKIRYGIKSRPSKRKDGRILAVTENLEIALRHLRRNGEARVLWIDAICINQRNLLERNTEVARMGAIFSKAKQVLVWLGPESEDSNLAVETLQDIGDDVGYDQATRLLIMDSGTPTFELERNPGEMLARERNWIAIKNILEREWFNRLWVVQEVKHATSATLLVGQSELQLRKFYAAFQWIWASVTAYSDVLDGIDMQRISFIMESPAAGGHETLDILRSTRHSICSDPRDRVYAVFNLLIPKIARNITPDYLLSPEEIYQDFILHHIEATSDLNILGLCSIHSRSMPSWVPDLSIPRPADSFCSRNASLLIQDKPYFFVDENLFIRGVHTTTIDSVGSGVSRGASLSEILALCRSWEPQNIENSIYRDGDTAIDAFMSTLITGFTTKLIAPGESDPPSSTDFRAFYHTWIRGQGSENLSFAERLCIEQLRVQLPGRTFFTTNDGYFGLCPEEARPGDQVCVIFNCQTPLVLRPISDRSAYQLVGECYAEGLMHGEGLLGQAPSSWKRIPEFIEGIVFDVWERDDIRTLDDPRAGPLPPGWRMLYEANHGGDTAESFDDNGHFNYPYFKNEETGDETYFDPRHTLERLRARGINIREFKLV